MSEPSDRTSLDAVTREAKLHLTPPELDWSRIEASVMTRVESEKPALVRDARAATTRAKIFRFGAAVLAAAAAVALIVRKDEDVSSIRASTTAPSSSAGSLRSADGEVRIGGAAASAGYNLRSGDVVEADGARAVFRAPRDSRDSAAGNDANDAVAWLLESEQTEAKAKSRAVVKSASRPLVVGLEDGAIEAQVTPVPSGEAFAVDVAAADASGKEHLVRVAVHGTHLRVTKRGTRIIVDLTEGVVSIGAPPRSGSTYGTLVTAPAHVEVDAVDLSTLKVDHEPSSVRAAIPLPTTSEPVAQHVESAPESAESPQHRELQPAATAPSSPAPSHPTLAPKAERPRATLAPNDAIAAAVRRCAAGSSRPKDMRVTVTSTLHLKVSASGDVENARFDPPIQPEVQSCVAEIMYKTKLSETGAVTVPLEFSF